MLGTPQIIVRSQASYDRQMKECEAYWRATGDPWAFAEALTLTSLHRQIPAWLAHAGWSLADKQRGKAHAKRAHEAAIRFMRYEAVRIANEAGLTWDESYAQASEELASTSAAAELDTMRKVYAEVKNDLEKGRGGLYFPPKKQHRR
jgi:hypothetical protein